MRDNVMAREPAATERPNMTPFIDVVFQLIVFFLVSMRFRSLDMKIEAQLPTDRGINIGPRVEPLPSVDVRLVRAGADDPTFLRAGPSVLGRADDDATWRRFRAGLDSFRGRLGPSGPAPIAATGEVDASPLVSTQDVIRAVDTFRAAGFEKVHFTGTPPAR